MNTDEWDRIRALRAEGETIKGIAGRLGMSRNTVRRVLTVDETPHDRRGRAEQVPLAELDRSTGSAIPDTGCAHMLPRYTTTFIGRRAELARLRGLLGQERLITLTGPGGIGKTRLATHVADQVRRAFPDGVRFIGLAGLGSPELISQAVLEGLRLAGRDQHGASAEEALRNHLSDRRMLLVLDNGEHLVAACASLVHELLQGSTQLRILVTSREVLELPGEHVLPLSPLPIDSSRPIGDDVQLTQRMDTAMALFESRAAAVLDGFSIDETNHHAVRRACERLDGLPLAIELACARLPVLSVDDLAARLDRSLDLLTTGNRAAASRHRSLAATLAWSHDLCTEEQQILWRRTSVFVGGFDLALAEEVCSGDPLPTDRVLDAVSALVSKSILFRDDRAGAVRFRMLETVREYGRGQLSADEDHALHLNLLIWARRRVRDLVAAWAGAEQVKINSWFRANCANLRAALKWALEDQSDSDVGQIAAEIVAEPWFLWAGGFSVREHRHWLHRAAEAAGGARKAQALSTLALVQTLQGDRTGATVSLDAAHALATEHGDEPTVDFVTHTRGLAAYFAGDFPRAEPLLLDALARYAAREPRGGLRSALDVHLGMLYASTGRTDLAEQHYVAVQQLARSSGERWFRAYAEFGLGAIELTEHDAQRTRSMALDGLGLIADFDDEIGATLLLELLGWTEAALGRPEQAAILAGSASKLWEAFGRQLYGSGHWVQVRDRYTTIARDRLGEERYAQLHGDGAALSISEVIAFALSKSATHTTDIQAAPTDANSARPPAPGTPIRSATTPPVKLSRREREVAELVKQGLSNRDIAARLVLSHRTVEGHVEHVLQKLCLTSRTQIGRFLSD